MPLALVREVSPALADCELTYLERQAIDIQLAARQHFAYVRALEELGVNVIRLAPMPEYPDSTFIEDTAVVLDELAVVCRSGVESRLAEARETQIAMVPFRPVAAIQPPGTLEGGDVLRVGRTLYAGRSTRSNDDGIAQLRGLVRSAGYSVVPVDVEGCLHLKTGCSYVGNRSLVIHPKYVDSRAFSGFDLIRVPETEPMGGNILKIGDTLIAAASYPGVRSLLESKGFRVKTVVLSEFQKAEAGPTCLSLVL